MTTSKYQGLLHAMPSHDKIPEKDRPVSKIKTTSIKNAYPSRENKAASRLFFQSPTTIGTAKKPSIKNPTNLIKKLSMTTSKYAGLKIAHELAGLTDEQIESVCNGCGPASIPFLPRMLDRICGVSVRPACCIHDLDYANGEDKKRADNRFFDNLTMIINRDCYFMRPVAHYIAFQYFLFVKHLGGPFYHPRLKAAQPDPL